MEMFWVIVYAFLGLLAFIDPRDVHETKSWFDKFDNLVLVVGVQVVISVFSLNATGITEAVFGLIRDSIEGSAYYLIYLIFANTSRGLWFGRFSFERIIYYFINVTDYSVNATIVSVRYA
jgi:hypothetical protein